MSLAPTEDQTVPAIPKAADIEWRPAFAEQAVAIGFLAAVSIAMIGWLYLLAVAAFDSVSWLFQ